uniref:Tripartite motif containing 35-30 n=1 Tax=Sinocyclocheilus grahami TaxID=75366 RepID=A0A672MVT8_SINGR
ESGKMACRLSITEEDFYCPICCDIFRDPVLLPCSHSICNGCVKTFWNRRGTQECPICRTVSSNPNPPMNIVLRNMCDLMREETTQEPPVETVELCSLHGEPLTFFCTEDQELACGKCRNAKSHKNHRIHTTADLRVRAQSVRLYGNTIFNNSQFQNTETKIKEAFEKLHQFLENEEAARMMTLRKEEEQKSEIIKKKIEEIRSGMLSLSRIIESIEEQLKRNDFTFLVVRSTWFGFWTLNCLAFFKAKYFVCECLKSEYISISFSPAPVTFDPNTAHPYLLVSDDLTCITYTDEHFQQLPANPERFDGYTSILGSEGFNSGTHCWDIEVGDSTAWAVGVITESAYKHRQTPSKTGLWYVGFCNGKYGKGYSPEILALLRVTQRIQRIRVQLDWDKGKVTFTDSARNIGLHVFKHTFTERVFPYFYSHCMKHPMRIIPVKTAVEAHV